MPHSAIHWPDRNIGKRESRQIREAHNSLYNDYHEALRALKACRDCLQPDRDRKEDRQAVDVLKKAGML